jgi:hypothetical protein
MSKLTEFLTMRISVSKRTTTEADVDRSVEAIRRVLASQS